MQTPAARRITALVFGLLCTTAACHHDFVGVIDGNVSTPAALDFGAVPVGQTKALALPLTNVTSGPLALSGARVEAPFSVTAAPDTIPGGGDGAVLVSFSPQAARAFDQPLELTLDSPGAEPVVVRLTGQGLGASDPAASFVIAPASLSFTSTLPALPAPQQLRVRNTNGASLHWSLGLAAAGGLAITPSTGTLHPGEFADLTVQVVGPSGAGRFSRVVSVDTTEAGSQLVEITLALDESGGGPPPPPAQYGASVWPKFHQGNSCTGLSSVYTHTTGAVRWTARFGAAREAASAGAYVGSPTLAADGTVYQVGGDGAGGHLSAFEPVKGAVRWRAPISAPSAGRGLSIETTPTVVADGSIFVLSGSENRSVTHFFKVSAQGSVLWSDPGGYTDGFDSSPALGADGTLYLAYDDAPAVVYFGQGGAGAAPKEQGRIALGASREVSDLETQSAAIGDDGTGYWSDDGTLRVVSKQRVLWTLDTTGGRARKLHSRSAPLLTPGGAVVLAWADLDGAGRVTTTISAVTAGTTKGRLLWQRVLGPTAPAIPPGPNGPGLDSGYASYGDRYALSSPALGPDGTLYIGHADGLYALAGADGAVKWRAGEAVVASSPAVGADGTIFFGAMDGKARAASPAGKILWSVQTGGQVNASPAIGADGAVFFASDDGLVYAVE